MVLVTMSDLCQKSSPGSASLLIFLYQSVAFTTLPFWRGWLVRQWGLSCFNSSVLTRLVSSTVQCWRTVAWSSSIYTVESCRGSSCSPILFKTYINKSGREHAGATMTGQKLENTSSISPYQLSVVGQ